MGNLESIEILKKVSFEHGDRGAQSFQYNCVSDSAPDWHLQAWMQYRGKRQADLVKELGWAKGRANKFFHSQHPYRREVVNELARWLDIEPWELLMEPARALKIRRLTEAVSEIVNHPVS